MAIAIEGFSIVGLKSRAEEKFAGGLAALLETVPNATALSDDELWRCSFMVAADAERFLDQLQEAGLDWKPGPDSDVVMVSEFDQSVTPYCEWLRVGQIQKGIIAWLDGTTPRKVIAKEGWTPEQGSGLRFAEIDDPNLEFVRLEGNLAVYRDKQTGAECYVGRSAPDPDELYKSASRIILANLVGPGEPPISGDAAEKVRSAVDDLRKVLDHYPDAWIVHFFLGKGHMAVGELEPAYTSLRKACDMEPDDEGPYRELGGLCLALGKADEAVQIGERAASLKPDNAETLSNLACTYLIAGRLQQALPTINAALKLDENDPTSRHLQRIIHDVMRGERPQPKSLADLM